MDIDIARKVERWVIVGASPMDARRVYEALERASGKWWFYALLLADLFLIPPYTSSLGLYLMRGLVMLYKPCSERP